MKRLFLIDGSSFCYRAFYAIRELSTSKGQPTNAVYGVVAMLEKLLKEEQPIYLAVAFDLKGPTFRHRRYEAYKENRAPMPEPLVSQMPWIKEVLRAFRIPIFEKEGVEADDLLGTIALRAEKAGWEVILVTSDKDMLQLLGPKVKVYRPMKEGHEMIDAESLFERWRLKPGQVVDVMALMGDKVDAIPGVPGIGEKTAVELIQKFGSLKKLLEQLEGNEKIRPHLAKAIAENRQQLELSRELATLDTEVPIDLELEELKRAEPDRAALVKLFQTLEFKRLLKEWLPEKPTSSISVHRIDRAQEFRSLLPEIRKAGSVAVNLGILSKELLGIGLAFRGDSTTVVSGEEAALGVLQSLGQEPKVAKICPDLKQTLFVLERKGISIEGLWEDPCLASYLLDPARPSHQISHLAFEFLGESIEHPDPLQAAGYQAAAAWTLWPRLQKEIEEKSLSVLLSEVEIPLSRVLARMQTHGIAVDRAALEALSKQMGRTLERLTGEIHSLAGGPFNINSPKQLSEVLFGRLKLPVIKRTKTGASTDEEVLRRLSAAHELPAKILEYREVTKLSSTYVEALPRLIDPTTGRIHTSFNQTVTATGRLSSSEPNLQNIPIRTELGRQIRRAFIPSEKGNRFLAADYSQVELRILAHLSQDSQLIEGFRQGADIHRMTAAEVFHVDPTEVSDAQRSAAKTINFGIIYGMSPFGLAKEMEISQSEAQEFIERYFSRYPGVRSYLDRSLEEARERGYCTTLFHRRRYIPELSAKDPTLRQFAERIAINAPIQGSAADLIKVAMISVDRAMQEKRLSSRMLLTVHDELVFEVPENELDEMSRLVKEIMESPTLGGEPVRLSVPIEVKLKTGRNWLEASH